MYLSCSYSINYYIIDYNSAIRQKMVDFIERFFAEFVNFCEDSNKMINSYIKIVENLLLFLCIIYKKCAKGGDLSFLVIISVSL